MVTKIWLYVAGIAIAGAAGWYVVHVQETTMPVPAPSPSPLPAVAQPGVQDSDLNKRRQEGIGSIRNLKPVPLPTDRADTPHK